MQTFVFAFCIHFVSWCDIVVPRTRTKHGERAVSLSGLTQNYLNGLLKYHFDNRSFDITAYCYWMILSCILAYTK